MFDSLVHNFVRVHFLHTNMQKDIAIKNTYSIVENHWSCINGLKYWIWDHVWIICVQCCMRSLFANEHTNIEYEVHNFARVLFLHMNIKKGVGTKHSYFIVYNGRICINSLKYWIVDHVWVIGAQFCTSSLFAHDEAKRHCDKKYQFYSLE